MSHRKRCQTCGKKRLLKYVLITGISCKSCLCMCQKEGCHNYVGGERYYNECLAITSRKTAHKLEYAERIVEV